MKRLLVASDLSERSTAALRRAVSLAKSHEADIHLLHVVDDAGYRPSIERQVGEATEALREEIGSLAPDLGLPCHVEVRLGDPFQVIVEAADQLAPDLLVLGQHRRRVLGDVFTGTTVERVMRIGQRPVLMVNRDDDLEYRNVLVALENDETSANALVIAAEIGMLPQNSAAVHAFLPLAEGMMKYAGASDEEVFDHVRTSRDDARAAIHALLSATGVDSKLGSILVEKGDPFKVIEEAVAFTQAELLVMGTRGRNAISRLLLGSVADQALRKLECDILVVPSPK